MGTQAAIRIPSAEAVLDYARATVFWQESSGTVSQHEVPPRAGASVPYSDRVWANSEYLRDFAIDPDGQLLALTYSTGGGTDRFTSRAIVSAFDTNSSFSAIDDHGGTTSRMPFAADDSGRWLLSPCRVQCADVNTHFLRDANGTWSDLPLPPNVGVCEESVAVAHGARLGLACMRLSSGGWGDAFYFLEGNPAGFSNVTSIDAVGCREMQGNVAPDGSVGLMGTSCSVATELGEGYDFWFARSSHNWTSWEIYAPLHESALAGPEAGVNIHSVVMDASGIFHIAFTPYPQTEPDPAMVAEAQLWYVAWDPARGVEVARELLDENNVPPGLLFDPAGKLRPPAMAVMAGGSVAIAWGHGDGFAVATMAPQ